MISLFKDKDMKLWKKALYAFLVGASLILLTFAIIYFPSIRTQVSGVVKAMPTREIIDVPVDEMLIVELYSK